MSDLLTAVLHLVMLVGDVLKLFNRLVRWCGGEADPLTPDGTP